MHFQNGGQASWNFYTDFWNSSEPDGACTNEFKTYYKNQDPAPPGFVLADYGR